MQHVASTLCVAVIGAGRIGRIHAANLAALPGVRVKYVVDVNAEMAQALAAQVGANVTDLDTVLVDAEVDAGIVCSSTDTHADLIERFATVGKHVFCEKPVDLDLARARACVDVVARAGIHCMIGFQRRFDPTFAALHARLREGEIGAPEMLVVTSRDPGAPPVEYIRRSGGIFRDMLIHDFDVFRWILDDDAVSVHATGSCLTDPAIAAAGDLDCTAVTLRTRKGRLCQINTTRRAAYGYDQRFEVLGEKGMLQAGNVRPTEVTAFGARHVSTDVPEAFFLERYRAAYAAEMRHFVESVRTGTAPASTVLDGLRALELADAASRSWQEGRVIVLEATTQ